MAFQLLPAQESDIPDIATVFEDAFKQHPVMSRLMCDVRPDVRRARNIGLFTSFFARGGVHFSKMVETGTGKLVAFSKWDYPLPGERPDETRIEGPYPDGTNVALVEDYYTQLWHDRKKWLDRSTTFFLHMLAVLPTHHRRGLGTRLIAPGLAAADAAGAKSYVEASQMGLPLYRRHGWEPVDEVCVDLERHGYPGEGWARELCLLREPGGGGGVGKGVSFSVLSGGGL